jgi:hypothetical protein
MNDILFYIKKFIPYYILLLIIGCAPSPRLYNSIPIINIQNPIDHSNKKLKIGNIMGGELTNEIQGSKIDAFTFEAVLIESIKKYKIFLITDTNADYILNATIMYQTQPLVGLDMTVNFMVKYSLINQNSNEEIWVKDINSIYTAKFSDSFIGSERLNMANEGAIRKNIEILLQTLTILEL